MIVKGYTVEPGANLRGADLIRADLTGANLRGVDLTGADLTRADLTGAYLRGADLTRADLTGANLRGTDLSGANLRGADLTGAKGIFGGSYRSDGYQFYAVSGHPELMIKAGCRWLPISEARKHWRETRAGTRLGEETTAILDCLEKRAALEGKP